MAGFTSRHRALHLHLHRLYISTEVFKCQSLEIDTGVIFRYGGTVFHFNQM